MKRALPIVCAVACFAVVITSIGVGRDGTSEAAASVGTVPRYNRTSIIDWPAADRAAPPDAVVNVKTVFGAAGDGRKDDTAAIQAAVSSGLGLSNPKSVIFFPAGTYLITKPVTWKLPSGAWSTGVTLLGENRDRTILKVPDASPNFIDPVRPRAVFITGSQNSDQADGSGNQAFNNFFFDLTIDVGARNPGADGIDYLANNRGAIRNVVVRAARDSGHNGIAMTRRWPGPALLEDVRIEGFSTGIEISNSEYSMTAEDLRLSGQRTAGINNRANALAVRRLVSNNTVPAIVSSNGYPVGLITLLNSELRGGATGTPAIDSAGGAYLRNIRTDGYSSTVRQRGIDKQLSASEEWTSDPIGQTPQSLRLPVSENPGLPNVPLSQMAGVNAAGARSADGVDDTKAIQSALNSGKPVVYLSAGRYIVSSTLLVPSSVKAVIGFEAEITATGGAFAGNSTAAIFSVQRASSTPLIISQVVFRASLKVVDVERLASRPIALTDVHIGGLPFRGLPGEIHLTDVEGGQGWAFSGGQTVWARQFDAEQPGTKVTNVNSTLWVLGIKTEATGTVIAGTGGSRTELLGGLLYPVGVITDGTPAFAVTDSQLSASVAISAYQPTRNYKTILDVTTGGIRRQLLTGSVPTRGNGSLLALLNSSRI